MPNVNNLVSFRFGAEADLPENRSSDTLYFTTDTLRLFVGDSEYTRPVQTGVDSPLDEVSCTEKSLYIQDTGVSQTIWYNATGNATDWISISSFDNLMALATEAQSTSDVAAIKAGQIYRFQDWVRLKTVTGSSSASSYLSLLDASKACTLIGSGVTDNQYATALSVYKWNRKVVELSSSQNLPTSWSTINSYDPLGVIFVKTVSQDEKRYYLCVHRDQTSSQFIQPVYVELSTYDQLQALKEQSVLTLEEDPTSSDAGVVNQIVYSISSNTLFKCTAASSTYTWERLHTSANVTYWDYATSSSHNNKVPDDFPGEVGDIVVITPEQVSNTAIVGGNIWQCYQVSYSTTTQNPDKIYLWKKINPGIRCYWVTDVPTSSSEGDLWDVVYVTVLGKTRSYQLINIIETTSPNPDYDPDDPDSEEYITTYSWTRLITSDDYVDTLLTFSTDPISGQTSQDATDGELNQLGYSTASGKFFRCTAHSIIATDPYNASVTWEEVNKVPKVTFWNYSTSDLHNFNPYGEEGELGDMIVITTSNSVPSEPDKGGAVWICYGTQYIYDTHSTVYFWKELRDGVVCKYLLNTPSASTKAHKFDLRWVGDESDVGSQDTSFKLFQNIGTDSQYDQVWKELLTENNVKQDISSSASQNTDVASAYAAKHYTDNKLGIPYVNPNTGKVTTYDGTYHDETYGPENQVYIYFSIDNKGAVMIQKDPYDTEEGVFNIRLVRSDEMDDYLQNYLTRVSTTSFEDTNGRFYLVRTGLSLGAVSLYLGMPEGAKPDKRIAWYSDLDNCVKVTQTDDLPSNNYGYESDPSTPSATSILTGEYTIQGDYCTMHGTAVLDANTSQVYFELPVEAEYVASTTFKDPSTTDIYLAQIDATDKTLLQIIPVSNATLSSTTVYFTLTYKVAASNS